MQRICLLVGSVALSGGTYVIFQHASYLRDHGFDVTLAVQEPFDAQTLRWHDEGPRLRCVPIARARQERFDLVVATWWKTALELAGFDAERHVYFVQSIESRFYPERERPLRRLVDSTYRLPVSYVTEARWIVDYLAAEFGQKAALVRNGIRKDIYVEHGPAVAERPTRQPRVLVEGHFNVPFKNTALAVRLARRAGARDIWVLTGSPLVSLPGVSRVFSRVPIQETPRIYRSCDILLKLSTVEGMFGPPLEIFHCGGTAMVFEVTGHDEYMQDGVNSIVVPAGDTASVVSELRALLKDREKLAALKKGALATASAWPSWSESSAEFSGFVERALNGPPTDRNHLEEMTLLAWSRYRDEEEERLRENPSIKWRYRLDGAVRRCLSPILDRRLRRYRALVELCLMPLRVR